MAEGQTITREQVLANKATPGSEGGRVVQEPLRTVGPRDALIADGKNAADYVPDVERLHLGFVPQPTVPIRDASGNVVGYLAQEDLQDVLGVPAKPVTLRDLKAAHNKAEGTSEWQRHIRPVGPAPLGEDDSDEYNLGGDSPRVTAARKAQEARSSDAAKASGGSAPTSKQAAVAEAEGLGLSTEGTEKEIRERIAQHQAAQGDQGSQGTDPTT